MKMSGEGKLTRCWQEGEGRGIKPEAASGGKAGNDNVPQKGQMKGVNVLSIPFLRMN
jgi:hypothetical protein